MGEQRTTGRPSRLRPVLALPFCLLGMCAACAKTGEDWRADLDSPDPFVRGLAAIGWSVEAPREAAAALPELLQTIDRSHVGLEREAALVLTRVGRYHVPALLDNLVRDPRMSADRRGAIQNALVAAGPAAAGPIVACMRGPGSDLAGDLGEVLLVIGAPAVPAIAGMLLEEPDVRLRRFAAFLLGRLGPAARAAVPALEAALEAERAAPDPELRKVAIEALAAIRGGR